MSRKWETVEQLKNLLWELVKVPSITGTEAEARFGNFVYRKLKELPYFQHDPEYLKLHQTKDGRNIVSALVKKKGCRQTVILLSHFDVVGVEDYGPWKDLAFYPEKLTESFNQNREQFSEEVQKDLLSGEWIFGRGTMDMKCGLALHMSMLEKAAQNEFNGNILLLTVCDEEANSVGMRAALPVLGSLSQEFNLDYILCLNSEPMFSHYPGDQNKYFYTGSIGKVLPVFYCMGKETHAGEPLAGLNANYLASMITCEMEVNTEFCERQGSESTPPPTNLMQKDLKKEYSVKIPDRAVTMFNVFLFQKPLQKISEELTAVAKRAARKIEAYIRQQKAGFTNSQTSDVAKTPVHVLTYRELYQYAVKKYGTDRINKIFSETIQDQGNLDDREQSILLADKLALLCKELAPMIVPFYAPPYYPAVCSTEEKKIQEWMPEFIHLVKSTYDIDLIQQNYFPGLCDLSYIGVQPDGDLQDLLQNMPLWQNGYELPLNKCQPLDIPVMNIGPFGKDAHKMTERLHVRYSLESLPQMLEWTIHRIFTIHLRETQN